MEGVGGCKICMHVCSVGCQLRTLIFAVYLTECIQVIIAEYNTCF